MTATATTAVRAVARSAPWWVGLTIVLVAINLRPAVVSVGPLLDELQDDIGLSATAAGVLTALPVLCFGLLAPLAPRLARRLGIERAMLGALVLLCGGFAVRLVPTTAALFVGAAMLGSAIALGNVLLPSLIKRDYPHRLGLMTGVYTMAISAGGALGAGLTVPVAAAAGLDWRAVLGVWGLFAVLALLAWIPQLRRVSRASGAGGTRVVGLWRSPLAWQVTTFMGLQSLSFFATSAWLPAIYVLRGYSLTTAGFLLSFASLCGVVGSMLAPVVAARMRRQSLLALGITALMALGLIGILAAPGWEVAATASIGVGQGAALGLALTMIALRTPDAPHAATLSGMAQSVGYVLAAAGPFAAGALHDLTGGWTVPLLMLILLCVPQAVVGLLGGRDRTVTSG